MANTSDNIENQKKWSWIAIGSTIIICGLITLWGIYMIAEYGILLFILVPLLLGIIPIVIKGKYARVEKGEAIRLGAASLLLFSFALLLFAVEGLICVAMSIPITFLLMWIGTIIGSYIIKKHQTKSTTFVLLILAGTITTGYVEKDTNVSLQSVTTVIEISAPPNKVWQNVVVFPKLNEPDNWLFKAGISYPTDATIQGQGVGAIRYCNFNTGQFVEPITVWDEPNILQFDVQEQPLPMQEISFWDIDAPHLHDYFVSRKGQFKLTKLENGNTLLEGTTWYYNKIRPNIYWNIWSDFIIHSIHERVLTHIKRNAEIDRNTVSFSTDKTRQD